ncbi:MAG TPA: maleylacetoacetate isomerase [Myxococcaceae bacterium]|nr:maleylacetoacetate isomerase [Myxococcaceae bacterium]
MLKLYGFYLSSAAFRARIALNLKGLAYESISVHLRHRAHLTPEYAAINPHQAVPVLVDGNRSLTQSLAIIEYLDETHPQPALLPATAIERARVRAMAQLIACDIHPLNNQRVLLYLRDVLGVGKQAKDEWYRHWIAQGFRPLEAMLSSSSETGAFSHGDSPTVADVCLVPQVYNAKRFEVDLKPYPTVMRIFEACMRLPAFDRAQPLKQADAE